MTGNPGRSLALRELMERRITLEYRDAFHSPTLRGERHCRASVLSSFLSHCGPLFFSFFFFFLRLLFCVRSLVLSLSFRFVYTYTLLYAIKFRRRLDFIVSSNRCASFTSLRSIRIEGNLSRNTLDVEHTPIPFCLLHFFLHTALLPAPFVYPSLFPLFSLESSVLLTRAHSLPLIETNASRILFPPLNVSESDRDAVHALPVRRTSCTRVYERAHTKRRELSKRFLLLHARSLSSQSDWLKLHRRFDTSSRGERSNKIESNRNFLVTPSFSSEYRYN